MNENNQVCVSYQDDNGVWKYVEQELKAHLPLRNVSWKTKTGATKVVEKLNINILPYDDERLQFPSQATNWYKKPFLYLYIVQCEDSDVYKQLVKGRIRTWVTNMQEKNQEWLIVYVSLGHRRFSELTSKLHRTVYDKIKTDFNGKRERCCQLRMADDVKAEDLWDDTLNKMKEGIVASMDQYISSYENELRIIDSKRLQPGWNYYNFFFLKECLAFTYERAGMYEEALIQYDELEALYIETPKQQGKFGGTEVGDDNANFLSDTPKKNIREMIYQNTITEFEFRQYLFARQSFLLFALSRPAVVAERAIGFINGMSIALAKNKPKNNGTKYLREAWVFSASMSLVEACVNHTPSPASPPTASSPPAPPPPPSSAAALPTKTPPKPPNPPSLQRFLSVRSQSGLNVNTSSQTASSTPGRATSTLSLSSTEPATTSTKVGDIITQEYVDCLIADLIYQARSKLDILGREFSLLPTSPFLKPSPSSVNPNTNSTTPNADNATPAQSDEITKTEVVKPTPSFSNPILQEAMQSEEQFDKLYLDMTQRSLGLYTAANRLRSAARLNFDMGFLHFHRKRWALAEPLLKTVSTTYSSERWYALEYNARSLLTECEKRLDHVHWYVSDCLALLAPNLPLDVNERISYVEQLITHSASLSPPLVRDLTPIFSITLSFVDNTYTLGASIQVRCTINSTLPREISIDKATLYLAPHVPTLLPRDNSSSSLGVPREKSPRALSASYSLSQIPTTPTQAAAVPSSPTTPEEGISISLQKITLSPGVNQLFFETEAKLKGQFVSNSMTLELGQLSFYHQLLHERSIINVTESTCKVALVASPPVSLLLKVPQKVLITIATGPEPLTSATLSVRSPTGVQFLDTPNEALVVVRNFNSEEGAPGDVLRYHADTLTAGKLPLLELSANEFVEVYIPVIANNDQPCVHQLRAELVLEKRTKEKFFVATSVALPFAHAFCVSSVCVPVTSPSSRILVQAVLTSTAGAPLTITDYSLQGPISILHDPNASHIKGTVVFPNQRTSLVFCITPPDLPLSQDITLDVNFTLPYPVPPFGAPLSQSTLAIPTTTLHAFSTPLTLALPSPQYIIETRNPPTAYLAQPIQFELLISSTSPSTPKSLASSTGSISGETATSTGVLFEIEEDPLWIISGKRKASIQLVGSVASVVSCRLRPISAGIIPVPKVRLCGLPASSFVVSPKGPPHVQVFPEPITSECTPTVADASAM